ncbi:MAG: hypothetical protein LBP90_01505 [Burkholderiales bacterium]|jgi:hypothetical protein|nr:hypothetical protein [Burkholderiales bacterium]
MASKAQMTGMRGVFLVAAELSRLGFIASPTSRSAIGADLLITDQTCKRTFSVQVKTNASNRSWWLVGEKACDLVAATHIYVLVNIRPGKEMDGYDYYVVPSRIVAKYTKRFDRANSIFFGVSRADLAAYHNKWSVFGTAV